ncbi:MAG: DUF2933 domain-containing protein [Aestuariivirga sp.]|jgi:hypothetical protein
MFGCFRSYQGWLVLGAATVLGAYLAIWHSAHVAVVLPFLVIAACPLMHLFMHRGHHHGPGTSESPPPAGDQKPKKDGE